MKKPTPKALKSPNKFQKTSLTSRPTALWPRTRAWNCPARWKATPLKATSQTTILRKNSGNWNLNNYSRKKRNSSSKSNCSIHRLWGLRTNISKWKIVWGKRIKLWKRWLSRILSCRGWFSSSWTTWGQIHRWITSGTSWWITSSMSHLSNRRNQQNLNKKS